MRETDPKASRRVFVHAHIPKCGGTTFMEILERNFKGDYSWDFCLLNTPYAAADVARILKRHGRLRALSSIRFSFDLPFDSGLAELVGIAFVRRPSDRFLSSYFYGRHVLRRPHKSKQHKTLEGYVKAMEEDGSFARYFEIQTRFLVGEGGDGGLGRVKERLEAGRVLLFPLERFDEACLVLARRYPEEFRDVAYAWRNRSPRNQAVTEEVRARLEDASGADQELYRMANAWLDAELRRLFPQGTGEALARHTRRCKAARGFPRRFALWCGRFAATFRKK
jgi:hypothetical protein